MAACGQRGSQQLAELVAQKQYPRSIVVPIGRGFRLQDELREVQHWLVRIWTLLERRKAAGTFTDKIINRFGGFSASAPRDVRDYAAKNDVDPYHVVIEFFNGGTQQSFTLGGAPGKKREFEVITPDCYFKQKLKAKHEKRQETVHLLGMGPLRTSDLEKLTDFLRAASSQTIAPQSKKLSTFTFDPIKYREIIFGVSQAPQPPELNCVAFAQWLFPEIVDCRMMRMVPIPIPGSCRALPGPRSLRYCDEQSKCDERGEERGTKRGASTEDIVQEQRKKLRI
jgi:hypothetical protein